ncbi:MAG: outer membrane lipoprotein-sorting protein [Alteromonadaceae bacterium]|nr:MAG: outer membrane lipoprotein-sorting protein [Alteromonadaceae bacterium]
MRSLYTHIIRPLVALFSTLSICSVFCLSASIAWAQEPLSKDPSARDIMQRLLDRNDGTSQVSQQKLTSCRYKIKNKKRSCAEKPRIKRIESVRRDYGNTEKDKRSVSILLDPPGERGISFLQYDYEDRNKDADQWMYLSALGKVKRIVSGSEDEPKKGSFFGSEFGYEDLEQRHIDDSTYTLLKEVLYRGRDCWVIEVLPTPERARKSNYRKTINWIDKERNLVLKSLMHNRQGKREKRFTQGNIKQIDGIWVAMSLTIDNLLTQRMSNFKLEKVSFNQDIEEDFLSLRTLNDGAFRESRLKKYRAGLQE